MTGADDYRAGFDLGYVMGVERVIASYDPMTRALGELLTPRARAGEPLEVTDRRERVLAAMAEVEQVREGVDAAWSAWQFERAMRSPER